MQHTRPLLRRWRGSTDIAGDGGNPIHLSKTYL